MFGFALSRLLLSRAVQEQPGSVLTAHCVRDVEVLWQPGREQNWCMLICEGQLT